MSKNLAKKSILIMFLGEIQRMGGSRLLDYLVNIVKGQLDYLPRLPTNVLHKIMLNTELQDISSMTLVSKQFREVGIFL